MRVTSVPLDAFSRLRVVVVGDVLLDAWMSGFAGRVAAEGPVPVIAVSGTDYAPGGAGNTAANVAALGGRVRLLGVVGDDPPATTLRRALCHRGVDDSTLVTAPGRRTAVKHRIVAGGQLMARYDEEDRTPIPARAEQVMLDRIERYALDADVVVVCDYAAGVCTERIRTTVAALCNRHRPRLIVDARRLAPWSACQPYAMLPNFAEVTAMLQESPDGDRVTFLTAQSERLLDRCGAELVVTTMDGDGALLHRRGRAPYRTHATPAPNQHATGAGDTFTAAFALALAVGGSPERAADLAQTAASLVVHQHGTATCTRDALATLWNPPVGNALSHSELAGQVALHRTHGERIVFTNGCFDVLHRGHIAYLRQAAALGDILVVAVNSDASVTRLKGPDRPINRIDDRVAVLTALDCVDHVTVFDDDTPEELLRLIRPDIYVKGGDYSPLMLPEASLVEELGGQVRIVDYVPDRSTSLIVQRIRNGVVAG